VISFYDPDSAIFFRTPILELQRSSFESAASNAGLADGRGKSARHSYRSRLLG
jgi:hypothetical protein